jgi:hypothetical protein
MKKEIYTPMEKILIDALITHEKMLQALELDLMLLEMEEKAGLMDGVKLC